MKKIITLVSLLFAYGFSNAQLANPDFENWENPLLHNTIDLNGSISIVYYNVCDDFDYTELENWSSTNQITKGVKLGGVELVKESTPAFSGAKALSIESKEIGITAKYSVFIPPFTPCTGTDTTIQNVAPGLIVNGSFKIEPQSLVDDIIGGQGLNALNPFTYPGVGEAIDYIPRSLSGHYQYNGTIDPDTGKPDSCIIVSGLKKNGVLIGHVVQRLGNAAAWTPFSIDYSHLSCEVPDTIVTVISSSSIDLEIVEREFIINSDFTGVDGSVLLLDALHLDTITLAEFPPILAADEDSIMIAAVATVDVLANDLFCDMGTYAPIVIPSTVSNGSASANALNQIEYTPPVSFTGTETFSYYICNAALLCDTTTVSIEVKPVAICYANDDTRTLNLATGATDYFDPRVNDVDCGSAINIVPGFEPAIGTAVVESNNFISYAPNNTSGGSDMFKYYTCSPDNANQCDTATVNISIISGINSLATNLISFYPNPASTSLNVAVDLPSEISLTIYNTLGAKMISELFFNAKEINISNLNNGLYYAEISVEGKKSIQKFQVIQ